MRTRVRFPPPPPTQRIRTGFRAVLARRWREQCQGIQRGPGHVVGRPICPRLGSRRIWPSKDRSSSAERSVRRSRISCILARRSSIHSSGGAWNTFSRLRRSPSSSSRRASILRSVSTSALASAWLPRPVEATRTGRRSRSSSGRCSTRMASRRHRSPSSRSMTSRGIYNDTMVDPLERTIGSIRLPVRTRHRPGVRCEQPCRRRPPPPAPPRHDPRPLARRRLEGKRPESPAGTRRIGSIDRLLWPRSAARLLAFG